MLRMIANVEGLTRALPFGVIYSTSSGAPIAATLGCCANISNARVFFSPKPSPSGGRELESLMSKPLVLSIPHRLGREEAARRLKSGLSSLPPDFHHVIAVQEQVWMGDHLQFRLSALAQVASGTIDVADDHVRLEVTLPWLLAQLVEKIQPLIRREGALMLEKK